MPKPNKAPVEISDTLIEAARKLIGEVGEEQAFQLTSLEMEACACEGDMLGMEEKVSLLFAITTIITARSVHTVH